MFRVYGGLRAIEGSEVRTLGAELRISVWQPNERLGISLYEATMLGAKAALDRIQQLALSAHLSIRSPQLIPLSLSKMDMLAWTLGASGGLLGPRSAASGTAYFTLPPRYRGSLRISR